jgi:hypothetical protein
MDLEYGQWTSKIWTSNGNYGLRQMPQPDEVHILDTKF